MMNILKNIINEEIDKVIAEKYESSSNIINEGVLDDIKNAIKGYLHKKKSKSKEEEIKTRKLKKKKEKDKKGTKKLRKTTNGGKEYYDYEDYKKKHRKSSLGDAETIRNLIDQENTDIAAVAREVFPDHTDEGAQSQLRKILNGERPMTRDIAAKLEKLISGGHIAIK